jgi:two-component system LytT family response regulator
MTPIKVLIVDDEPLARRGIRMHLDEEPDVAVVAECTGGREAVAVIRAEAPDLVFLDVQMPEMDGFEVIEEVGVRRMPVVIFVTAYDQYALQAFDAHALDYVLKPIDEQRFREALARARAHLQLKEFDALQRHVQALLDQIQAGHREDAAEKFLERLVVKEAGRVFFLKTEEVDWMETAGNYVRLHVGREAHLIRDSLSGMEAKLPPDHFLRIRRSTIVNVDRIKELQPLFNGEYVFRLKDGTKLTSSRRYRANLDRLLGTS